MYQSNVIVWLNNVLVRWQLLIQSELSYVLEGVAAQKPKYRFNYYDVGFIVLVVILVVYYQSYVSRMGFPAWDAGAYLENARNWIQGEPLLEPYRPPLMSWIIAGIWLVAGEDWELTKYIHSIATTTAGVILYIALRRYKGSAFALGVSSLTMLNPWVFFNGTQIITEGLGLLFLVLTLLFLKTESKLYWFFAGIAIALTFVSRYPIIVPALSIFLPEAILHIRKPKLIGSALLGLVPLLFLMITAVYLKNDGSFSVALEKDTGLSTSLSPFYVENAVQIFGYAVILIPIAFLFKRTYLDRYNYAFIVWFALCFIFWSANEDNHQERFMIQVMPAAYYLSILAIENLWKNRLFLSDSTKKLAAILTSYQNRKKKGQIAIAGLCISLLGFSILAAQQQVDSVTVDRKLYDPELAQVLQAISARLPADEVVVTSSTGPQVAYFTGLGAKIPRGPDSHRQLVEYMWKNEFEYLLVFENQSKTGELRPLFSSRGIDNLNKTFTKLSTYETESSTIHLYQLQANLTRDNMILITDTTKPRVEIISPLSGASRDFNFDQNKTPTIELFGTSSDSDSGIKSVDVRIQGQTSYESATSIAPGEWYIWSANFHIESPGVVTVTAKATDHAGNQEWHEITVDVRLIE